jgi:hypothetical protein
VEAMTHIEGVGKCVREYGSVMYIQMPGNDPEESIRHSKDGESLKSRNLHLS